MKACGACGRRSRRPKRGGKREPPARACPDCAEAFSMPLAGSIGRGSRRPPRIHREAPGVPQPEGPDLLERGDRTAAAERVARRDSITFPVRVGDIDVDAQYLPQQRGRILRAVRRVVAAAAITHPDVEEAVGAKQHLAAVVIGAQGLHDESLSRGPLQVESRIRIGLQRIRGRALKARDDGVAVGVSEIDVEPSARGVVRWKRETQQATIVRRRSTPTGPVAPHRCGQVEKVQGLEHSAVHDTDHAALLEHVLPGRIR